MQQVAAADEVLQRRKAAVTQLAYVLNLAQDLDAADRSLQASSMRQEGGPGGLSMQEQLAALLGGEE